jgi:predicted HTH domain antitoxin
MTEEANIYLPEEVVHHLRDGPLKDAALDDQVRRVVAIHLYLTHQVSLGAAADMAGLSYLDFWDLLQRLDLPVLTYGEREQQQDLDGIRKFQRSQAAS